MDIDHLGNLAASIHAARAWPAGGLALTQAMIGSSQLADRQGIDRVVDRLAAGEGISEVGMFILRSLPAICSGDKRSRCM